MRTERMDEVAVQFYVAGGRYVTRWLAEVTVDDLMQHRHHIRLTRGVIYVPRGHRLAALASAHPEAPTLERAAPGAAAREEE